VRAENEAHERMVPRKTTGRRREVLKEEEAHEGRGSGKSLNRFFWNTDTGRDEGPEVGQEGEVTSVRPRCRDSVKNLGTDDVSMVRRKPLFYGNCKRATALETR